MSKEATLYSCVYFQNVAWEVFLLHKSERQLLLIITGVLKQRDTWTPAAKTLSLHVIRFSYPLIVPWGKKYKASINFSLSHTTDSQPIRDGLSLLDFQFKSKLKMNCAILRFTHAYLFWEAAVIVRERWWGCEVMRLRGQGAGVLGWHSTTVNRQWTLECVENKDLFYWKWAERSECPQSRTVLSTVTSSR